MKVGVLASGNRRPPLSQSDLWVLRQRPYRRMSAWRFLSGNCPAQTGTPQRGSPSWRSVRCGPPSADGRSSFVRNAGRWSQQRMRISFAKPWAAALIGVT